MLQVLECSWDELWNKVQQAQDLDHIIAAHEVFLDTIIARCLLDSDSRVSLLLKRLQFYKITITRFTRLQLNCNLCDLGLWVRVSTFFPFGTGGRGKVSFLPITLDLVQ